MLTFAQTSNEALHELAYISPPNLSTELTKCFQKVIDFKKENSENAKGAKLIKMVNGYFTEKVAPEVLKVIEKYTGLDLSMAVANKPFYNCAIGFSIRPEEWDSDKGWQFPTTGAVNARYSGKLPDELYREIEKHYENVKTQKELEELSKTIMKDKAAMKAGMFHKYKLAGVLYVCPFLFFHLKEMFGPNFVEFTAEQISAIVTHECGHVIAFIVHAKDLCYKKQILYNGAKKAYKNFSNEEKLKVTMRALKHMYPEKYKKMREKLSKVKNKNSKNLDGSDFLTGFSSIFIFIGYLIFSSFYVLLRFIGELLAPLPVAIMEHADSYDLWGKSSDFSQNSWIHGYYDEEMADEYVSKMGYSHHLVRALDTMRKTSAFSGTKGYHNVGKVDLYIRLLPWIAGTLFFGLPTDYIHPTWFKREENAIMDIMKAFKSDNMDPRLLEDYYKAYKDAKALYESKTTMRKTAKIGEAIQRVFDYILTTPTAILVNGRFQEEYDRLYRQTQQLMDNQLYALSYGLRRKGE